MLDVSCYPCIVYVVSCYLLDVSFHLHNDKSCHPHDVCNLSVLFAFSAWF